MPDSYREDPVDTKLREAVQRTISYQARVIELAEMLDEAKECRARAEAEEKAAREEWSRARCGGRSQQRGATDV